MTVGFGGPCPSPNPTTLTSYSAQTYLNWTRLDWQSKLRLTDETQDELNCTVPVQLQFLVVYV